MGELVCSRFPEPCPRMIDSVGPNASLTAAVDGSPRPPATLRARQRAASANADERLAELKHVAAPQPNALHGAPVHPRAVARPEVADDADAAAQRDLGVAARDCVVGEHEVATRAAADPRAALERPLDAVDDQRSRRRTPVPPAR